MSSPSLPGPGRVLLGDSVHQVCLTHALMTEREEVMGLLLGDVFGSDVHIWSSMTLRRSDKRPDRCEISPEQLSEGVTQSDKLSTELGRVTRVVGWYHSHPHITVLPSHVDLRTQYQYQAMDERFIGLIFTVFNTGSRPGSMKFELMAFRAVADGELRRVGVQVDVVPMCQLGWSAEQEALAAKSEAFGGALGQLAMVATTREGFEEVCDEHRRSAERLAAATSRGQANSLSFWVLTSWHINRLSAMAMDEVAPLAGQLQDDEHNARALLEVYRECAAGRRAAARPEEPEAMSLESTNMDSEEASEGETREAKATPAASSSCPPPSADGEDPRRLQVEDATTVTHLGPASTAAVPAAAPTTLGRLRRASGEPLQRGLALQLDVVAAARGGQKPAPRSKKRAKLG